MLKWVVKLPIMDIISNDSFKAFVKDVQKAPNGQPLHTVIVESGEMHLNETVTCNC